MKTKTLSLMTAAALGIGLAVAAPTGKTAQAEGFHIDLRFGDGYYRDHRYDRRHRYGRRYHRVHPRLVHKRLRHRGYYRIRHIRYHSRPLRIRRGRVIRGFYTARAWHHGRPYIVYTTGRGHAVKRRPLGRRHYYRYRY